MENADGVSDKLKVVLDKVDELGEKNEVVIVEMDTESAEMILIYLSLIKNENKYRNRVYAIVLFESAGLHIKGVDGTWETLKQLAGPAVLLVPSGIVKYVRQASGISWGKESEEIGCRPCLYVILFVIICGVIAVIISIIKSNL